MPENSSADGCDPQISFVVVVCLRVCAFFFVPFLSVILFAFPLACTSLSALFFFLSVSCTNGAAGDDEWLRLCPSKWRGASAALSARYYHYYSSYFFFRFLLRTFLIFHLLVTVQEMCYRVTKCAMDCLARMR
jgi:hypothetical protein